MKDLIYFGSMESSISLDLQRLCNRSLKKGLEDITINNLNNEVHGVVSEVCIAEEDAGEYKRVLYDLGFFQGSYIIFGELSSELKPKHIQELMEKTRCYMPELVEDSY